MEEGEYIPALRYRKLTALYDLLIAATTKERRIRARIVELAGLCPRCRVLDVGCGTGTLAILAKELRKSARVVGVDGDPDVLAIAREKARERGVEVELQEGRADALPFGDGAFDVVTSSLVFHHLPRDTKRRALREIRRVLAPGGRFILADWGAPRGPLDRLAFYAVQLLDGFETTGDNVRGLLPDLAREAGFADFAEVGVERTVYGILSFYRGTRPEEGP